MRNCYTEEEISRYLDGELDPRESGPLQEHLESCSGCREIARRLYDTGIVLKSCRQKAAVPSPSGKTACPEEGVLIAFADGSIQGEEKRKEIALHLARCNHCAEIVAESVRAADLAAAAAAKPMPVPARLDRVVEERFFSAPPVFLGRIKASLSEIRNSCSRIQDSTYPIAPSFERLALVAEEPELFPARRAPELFLAEEDSGKRETSREIRKTIGPAKPRPDERTRQRSASNRPPAGKKNPG